ncbi:MAG: SCP2 sterol-binding domain-containing protein [Pseudomonadota bacterium]
MSDLVTTAVEKLNEKLAAGSFAGSAKFDIAGEGSIVLDSTGARASEEDTDVTLSADVETFQSILEGETDPTSAFMSGKLTVDGDMGMAMQLAAALG